MRSMIELNTTGYKKSLLLFSFKLQLIGIHSPIPGRSVTVFFTLAIKKFFSLMKLISPFLLLFSSSSFSLSVHILSHLSLLPALLLGPLPCLLLELLSDLLLSLTTLYPDLLIND